MSSTGRPRRRTDAQATASVADLFNVVYEVLLQVLYRLLARVDESEAETAVLAVLAR
jgi:hypothetical protein